MISVTEKEHAKLRADQAQDIVNFMKPAIFVEVFYVMSSVVELCSNVLKKLEWILELDHKKTWEIPEQRLLVSKILIPKLHFTDSSLIVYPK